MFASTISVPVFFLFLLCFCLTFQQQPPQCKIGNYPFNNRDIITFCPNEFNLTSDSFVSDPETRYYNNNYYMSFTGILFPTLTKFTVNIYMSIYNSKLKCWDNITQVTFDGMEHYAGNEVSTFFIQNLNNSFDKLYIYYNHYLFTSDDQYNITTWELRLKIAYINNEINKFIGLNETENVFQTSNYTNITVNELESSKYNTFIIYTVNNQLNNQTIHPNFNSISTCYPVTEPSVITFIDKLTKTVKYTLSVSCLEFSSMQYGIKFIESSNAYFINDEKWSDGYILKPNTIQQWCTNYSNVNITGKNVGWVAGSLIIYDDNYYIAVSPFDLNGHPNGFPVAYGGCVFMELPDQKNLLTPFEDINGTIQGDIALFDYHSGSCTGGVMNVGMKGKTDVAVMMFYEKDPSGFYHIYNEPWPL